MKTVDEYLKPMQKHIKPLNMNGLNGRMLYLRAPKGKKRNILLIYGHHSSIERMYGLAEALNEFGSVVMPDLPGFGGMDSFHSIGMKPSIDAMADYLASFIIMKYKNKRVSLAGMSLGFVIITRMLQRYPDLVNKIDLLVSLVGFSHRYDFSFSAPRMLFYRYAPVIFTKKLPAAFFHKVALHPSVIRYAYAKGKNAKAKMSHLSEPEKDAALAFEVTLWRDNEVRTYMKMSTEMMSLDNCRVQVPLTLHHVSIAADQYFDSTVVEQHMRVIFNDYIEHQAILPAHTPSILATKEEAEPLIPESIKKVLES